MSAAFLSLVIQHWAYITLIVEVFDSHNTHFNFFIPSFQTLNSCQTSESITETGNDITVTSGTLVLPIQKQKCIKCPVFRNVTGISFVILFSEM